MLFSVKRLHSCINLSIFFFRQGKCIQYIYGGCFGTENLFDTQSLCEARCPPLTAASRPSGGPPTLSSMWIQPPLCQQGPMQADFRRMCMGYMPKFTYNETEGRIERCKGISVYFHSFCKQFCTRILFS